MIARGARSLRAPLAVGDFDLEAHFTGSRIVNSDEKAGDVEHAAHFRIDPLEQGVELERRTERPADFIEDVQLLGAPRRLLHQVAVFDRHADLLAESHQQAEFGGRESAIIRRGQQQHAKHAALRLKADANYGAHLLLEQQLPCLTK